MAGNIVTHGFIRDNKKHSVDIRVICRNQDIILRMRDDCRAFNPSERLKVHKADEDFRNIGIRIAYSLAKEVNDQNLLDQNVLTLRL